MPRIGERRQGHDPASAAAITRLGLRWIVVVFNYFVRRAFGIVWARGRRDNRPMQKPSLTYSLVTIADDGIGSAARLFELRFGRSVQEIRVLRLVRDSPGITFTDLARLTRVERSATSRLLTRLIEAGLVLRTGSPGDARRFPLTITRKGQALCAKADPLTEELEALMLEPLTRAQRETFLAMLERLRAWVGDGYRREVEARFPEAASPRGR
jgi:DNA-binding MarR family transcriptional regulator